METRYYAAIVREDGQAMMSPRGPYETWSAANAENARKLGLQSATIKPPKYRHITLLDVSSVQVNRAREMHELLEHDPMLRAVWELGRQYGMHQAASVS